MSQCVHDPLFSLYATKPRKSCIAHEEMSAQHNCFILSVLGPVSGSTDPPSYPTIGRKRYVVIRKERQNECYIGHLPQANARIALLAAPDNEVSGLDQERDKPSKFKVGPCPRRPCPQRALSIGR